ncbi:hypothetical protein WDU94_005190, partial [Cyamophila willieti]
VFFRALSENEVIIKRSLEPLRIVEIATSSGVSVHPQSSHKPLLSGFEIMTIVLGTVIFLGAITAAICLGCISRKKKHFGSMSGGFIPSDLSFTLTGKRSADELSNCKPKSLFHPSAFVEDSSDSYPDVPKTECRRHRSARYRHDVTCARHPSRRQVTRSSSNAHLNSLASLHSSSGKDSGIDNNSPHRCCPCSQSSNSSNGSYEDSLRSLHRQPSINNGHVIPGSARLQRKMSQRGICPMSS